MAGFLETYRSVIIPEGTYKGVCSPVGDMARASCLAVLEFTPDATLRPNQRMLDYVCADERLMSLPAFVSSSLEQAARSRGIRVERTFSGESARGVKENLGTYGEVNLLERFMKAHGHNSVVGVTDGHNIANVARQAGKVGIEDFVIPPNLPHAFDLRALKYLQPWTSTWLAWIATVRLRQTLLERKGH